MFRSAEIFHIRRHYTAENIADERFDKIYSEPYRSEYIVKSVLLKAHSEKIPYNNGRHKSNAEIEYVKAVFAKYVVYLRGNYGYKNDKHRCRKCHKHIYKKNRFRSVP